MHRLYDFLRRHPTGVDTFWALLLLGICLLAAAEEHGTSAVQRAVNLGTVVALSLVIALRRRAPIPMLFLAIASGLAQIAGDVQGSLADTAMLAIVYTVASGHVRWASRVALAGGLAAPVLFLLRWPLVGHGPGQTLITLAFLMAPFVLAWVLGDSMRTRRAYWAQLEERAARLEKDREQQARMAVTAERARIARELHDVVAHNVSVMVVQADGAAYVLDASPEQAKQALETISGTGRQALAEMRRLLGVLRTEEGTTEGGDYVPQPDVEQIGDLVEQVRGAGLPVEYEVEGAPRPLPSGVELTAYRIVQEALTNTRKHGGPEAGASVRLTYFDDGLGLLVEDDGRGAQHELYESGGADGMGHGLIGMRERVGMVGGTLDAGPRPGGGFRISVLLPVKPGGR
ncbi:sensor histidine kinase [Streptomyces roseoverticillatus]|uniref:sensor histidine kinase n=1 Tax=Streptomyces roseoverticillatus TaxID=66429 RepID=UPI001F376CD3|nr:sensor histidine kinase [Streptomyces roseoverticillatus]MCF3100540.1 sensor histidine kinase [Streptomyces roseoverticillatus]